MPAPVVRSASPIPRGEPGILRTVEAVRNLVRASRALPAVRTTAVTVTRSCGRSDDRCKALAILAWVRDHLRYVKDPVDTELVHAPELLVSAILERGEAAGDCDDAAALVGALDHSIGLPARLVVASFMPSGQLHHVWAEAFVGQGYVQQDPFRSEHFDRQPTRVVLVRI